MPLQEERWAVELKKAQQKTRQVSGIPLGIRKGQVQEQMGYQKNLLQSAILGRDKMAIEQTLGRLIELRGEQTALALKEMEELYGTVALPALEAEVRQYYAYCARLAAAVASP